MTRLTTKSLEKDIEKFLVFKHALGYRFLRGEATLRSFHRFATHRLKRNATINLAAAINDWLSRATVRKPVTRSLELGPVRQLCHFRRRRDPTGYVPSRSLAPQTESHHVPFIFSIDQIRALVEGAGRHEGRNFWPGLLRLLILTTYCTGLRLGETVRLRCADVDLHSRILHVHASKGRTRLVPFGADLAREFLMYWPQRDEMLRRKGRDRADAVFIGRYGRAITLKAVSEILRRMLRQQGLKCPRGRIGPRPYDLRHAFAVHRLTAWYREGADIHARLPWLSAYMGHVSVLGTETYLHATPELLQFASDRFARRVAA